jgi:hypothetical protein
MLQRSFVIPLHKTSVFTLLFIVRRTHQCGVKLSYATIESYMFQPLWGRFQAYKIWYRTRYVCCCYLRDPVVYSTLVIKYVL